ncbi:MAG TPA: endonuclease/exonuclease/phosphatase family protein, partial [Saprospiraceae bacterium]|nr:endonuclease/exonuclease/phosphatase family protein [Saprospiraceae bacterium]
MKISRPLRLWLAGLLALFASYFLFLFAYGWATDWEPEQQAKLEPDHLSPATVLSDSVFRFVTWNVGFGGLGAESDFFYDDQGMWYSGSSMVRSPRPLVEKNLRGALDFFREKSADFYLLQEVDVNSDRSYRIDQYAEYGKALDGYCSTMALNYICPRVPIPLLEPWNAYGKVVSGLG